MSETAEASMTPETAAEVLSGLEGYEEELTARTAGLTWMLWGLAIPGLFLTYAAAGPWLDSQPGLDWVYGVLWVPWILAASLATDRLWTAMSVSLDVDHDSREGWLHAGGFTLLFFVLAGTVRLATQGLGVALGPNAWMLSASGLLTVAIGVVDRRRRVPGTQHAAIGGGLLVLAAVGLALASPVEAVAGLASAAAVGLVYVAIGARLHARG